MGMFDSFIDPRGDEWQTKAFGRNLSRWRTGAEIPGAAPFDFQVEVYGGAWASEWEDAYATISGGTVALVPDQRHPDLPLLDYHGAWVATVPARSSSEGAPDGN